MANTIGGADASHSPCERLAEARAMSEQPYDAIVIGAGHNGLACACYRARAGMSVLVLVLKHLTAVKIPLESKRAPAQRPFPLDVS